MDVVRTSLEQYVALHETDDPTAKHCREIIAETRELQSHHYQNVVASWRLARAARQVSLISASHLELDAFSAKVYLLKVLMELIAKFDDHDEFLVVTNLEFWDTDHSSGLPEEPMFRETADDYLFSQLQAIKRGMALSRIFFMEENSDGRNALARHKDFLKRALDECPDCAKRVEVRYRYAKLVKTDAFLFACVRRREKRVEKVPSEEGDRECLVIEPDFSKVRFRLRLLFSKGPGNTDASTNEYINRFFHARSNSHPMPPPEGENDSTDSSRE